MDKGRYEPGVEPEDDGDRAYEAARDEDLTGPADEELAETQEALAAERDERDEALSLAEALEHLSDTVTALEDQLRSFEREELHGDSLLWWRDDSLLGAFEAMADLLAEVTHHHRQVKMILDQGVPQDLVKTNLELNFVTGPIVFGALQLFGLWLPEVRDTIKEIIATTATPEATNEETEMIQAAIDAAEAKLAGEARDRFHEMAKAAEEAKRQHAADIELGLDPN